jgi:hypothetical protein
MDHAGRILAGRVGEMRISLSPGYAYILYRAYWLERLKLWSLGPVKHMVRAMPPMETD